MDYVTPNFSEGREKAPPKTQESMLSEDKMFSELELEQQVKKQKQTEQQQSLDPVYRKQRELKRKMLNRNTIFFNRQIMIEKDLLDKSRGLTSKNISKIMES